MVLPQPTQPPQLPTQVHYTRQVSQTQLLVLIWEAT